MEAASQTDDTERVFLDSLPLIDKTIRSVCRAARCQSDEAEDFASHARLKLIEGNYRVLRAHTGRCSLRTYLMIVVQRQFLDYRRQHWGTWRPSAEARRLGPIGIRLDKLLHRERLGLEEAIERVRRSADAVPDDLLEIARRLPPHFPRRFVGEEALEDLPTAPTVAEELVREGDRTAHRRSLGTALTAGLERLDAEDRVMLTLRFRDGISVARIAHMLGLEAKPLYRRFERLLGALRVDLEGQGFDTASVSECLGGDGGWPDPFEEAR